MELTFGTLFARVRVTDACSRQSQLHKAKFWLPTRNIYSERANFQAYLNTV